MTDFQEAARLAPRGRGEWRRWLEENHASSGGVWLLLVKKNAAVPGLAYDEAVEEALCFGWIDSRVRRIDEEHFRQWYCPRRPGSIWSLPNKQRVARLVGSGRMTPAGMAKIEAAQADGSWEILDRVESMEIPEDLGEALAAAPGAATGFAALAPSLQKQYLYWVLSAKRAQTRATRVAAVVAAALGQGSAS